jgi:hypothetical protein
VTQTLARTRSAVAASDSDACDDVAAQRRHEIGEGGAAAPGRDLRLGHCGHTGRLRRCPAAGGPGPGLQVPIPGHRDTTVISLPVRPCGSSFKLHGLRLVTVIGS